MDPNVSPAPTPEQPSGTPESGLSIPELVAGQAAPQPSAAPPAATSAMPVVPDSQTVAVPPAGPNPLSSSSYDGPLIASDVDVIEKEWVDRADAEIKRTAGDPYAEEEAVENLQIDYLKKRYGKDIRKSEDS